MLETTLYEQLQEWWNKHNLVFPSFEICDTDRKMGEIAQVNPLLMAFAGLYHPIQYFCRLKESGVDTPTAKELCKVYEHQFYRNAEQQLLHQYQYRYFD